mmetsp:Transcript_7449/g.5368  ORF Transcript_7449/g.5368 Transcript_7449/m.5368 type:complete len:246 (-) Transcript_7449:82-819(-)
MLPTISLLPTTVPQLLPPAVSLTPLTGLPKVLLPPSKTRVSAVHAGLSPLASPSVVPTSSKLASSLSFPSSKSSVAPPTTSATVLVVATVVTCKLVTDTPARTPSCPSPTTLTTPVELSKTDLASTKRTKVSLVPNPTKTFKRTTLLPLRMPSNNSQSPSPLMLAPDTSTTTVVVSSTTLALAAPPLITPSSLSVGVNRTVPSSTSLRTPGVPTGVRVVTLDSPSPAEKVCAVARWLLSIPLKLS